MRTKYDMKTGMKKEKILRKGCVPVELIEALEEYLDRNPKKKKTVIYRKSVIDDKSILMEDMPNQIRKGTEIGVEYEKALYKMAFEELLDGSKKL